MTGTTITAWTRDVEDALQAMGLEVGDEFKLIDAYRCVPLLTKLHPNNSNVEAKIRQQLQVLKHNGVLRFLDNNGNYQLLKWLN
jgi:hypothetical protein